MPGVKGHQIIESYQKKKKSGIYSSPRGKEEQDQKHIRNNHGYTGVSNGKDRESRHMEKEKDLLEKCN